MASQVGRGGDAVPQIILVQRFLDAYANGFEVASGKPAIGRVSFGQDQ
jgi:hypothetical protein